MKSMTGFGQGEAWSGKKAKINVEISSLNRKQLDLRPNMPREFAVFEPLLKQLVSEKVARGAINVSVTMEYGASASANRAVIDERLAAETLKKCARLQERFDLPGRIEIADIIKIPGIVEVQLPRLDVSDLQETFELAVGAALDALVAMRSEEGDNLKKDLKKRVDDLRSLVDEAKSLAKDIPVRQRDRLLQRLKDADIPMDASDERIFRELVIFSDRADVSEEITRLGSHFDQFVEFINDDEKPIGRSIDFLVQEINREITTLGNKAVDTRVSPLVVKLKTGLEKIREQVQNVE